MFSYILSKRPANLFVGLIFFPIFVKICYMEKRSSHWLDTFSWVRKVYLSCNSREQEYAAERLLMNFERLHKDKDAFKLAWDLRDEYIKMKYKK